MGHGNRNIGREKNKREHKVIFGYFMYYFNLTDFRDISM